MSADRRMFVLVLYFCAIQLRGTMGGNPTDSANFSARNASNVTSSDKNNTLSCQEDVLDQCPPNTSCDKGRCVCLFGYKLNPAYHGKPSNQPVPPLPADANTSSTNVASSTYCLTDESNHLPTSSAGSGGGGGTSSSNKPTNDGASTDASHAGQLPLREPARAHHILGGVLIPLAFVVILIGSALLAKRAQLWSRLRQRFLAHRNRHRRRPAYEDVVLVGFEPQAGGL